MPTSMPNPTPSSDTALPEAMPLPGEASSSVGGLNGSAPSKNPSRRHALALAGAAGATLALSLMSTGCGIDASGASSSSDTTDATASQGNAADSTAGNTGNTSDITSEADALAAQQEALKAQAASIISSMTLEQKIYQLFVVDPEALTGYDLVTAAGDATRESLAARPVGGIIYFGQNLIDPDQTRTMLSNTQQYAREISGVPLLLCVDEEGGTVARIARNEAFGVTNPGNMCDMGATGDTTAAYDVAAYMGDYLTDLGFTVDFAPVCDVADNPDSDTMALRSFGSDPELVASMVEAQVQGFTDAGILCTGKHFPGIGAAVGDSHNVGIEISKTLDELAADELIPFDRAIQAGIPLIMVGHLSLPVACGTDTPACLEPQVITGMLRERLGFDGLVITDSLGMGAITLYHAADEAAVLALQAGADLLLMPEDFDLAVSGVRAALEGGTLTEARIDESLTRILVTKLGL